MDINLVPQPFKGFLLNHPNLEMLEMKALELEATNKELSNILFIAAIMMLLNN